MVPVLCAIHMREDKTEYSSHHISIHSALPQAPVAVSTWKCVLIQLKHFKQRAAAANNNINVPLLSIAHSAQCPRHQHPLCESVICKQKKICLPPCRHQPSPVPALSGLRGWRDKPIKTKLQTRNNWKFCDAHAPSDRLQSSTVSPQFYNYILQQTTNVHYICVFVDR